MLLRVTLFAVWALVLTVLHLQKMEHSKIMQWAKVRIFRIQGKTVAKAHSELLRLHGGHTLSVSMVRRWFKKFAAGLPDISVKKTGELLTKLTPAKLAEIRALLDEDNTMCIHVIARRIGLSLQTVHHALRNKMKLKKHPAKYVPHALTDQQRQRRVTMARDLQMRFTRAPTLQDRVVTGDKSWFWCYEPEMKRSTSAWLCSNECQPQKTSKDHHVRKVMLIIFWNAQGVIHREFVPDGHGVDRHVYLRTMKELREKLRRHCPDLWRTQNFWLHHDSALTHRADIVVIYLDRTNTKILPHPPYSPDLAPSDFFLFARMKKNMRGITFNSVEALKQWVDFKLGQIAQWEYAHALHESWNRRIQACIDHEEHDFEN